MSGFIMNADKPNLLTALLATSGVDYTLKLFQNNYSVTASTTTGSLTEATFTGYASQPLYHNQWTISGTSGTATANYNNTLTWTLSGTTQTVYGYAVYDGSGNLAWAETYPAARTLNSGDVHNLTVQFALS